MPGVIRFAPISLLLFGAACAGPITTEEALKQCAARAEAAKGPKGIFGVGFSSRGGVSTGIGISVTGDFLRGRAPEEVFETCVIDKTGSPPPEGIVYVE